MFCKSGLCFILISLFATSCATNQNLGVVDQIDAEIERFLNNRFEVTIFNEDGLSEDGCHFLFPTRPPQACISEWEKQKYVSRLDYLHEYGSLVSRVVFELGKEKSVTKQKFSPQEMFQCLQYSFETNSIYPDFCILIVGAVATEEEVGLIAARLEKHGVRIHKIEEVDPETPTETHDVGI